MTHAFKECRLLTVVMLDHMAFISEKKTTFICALFSDEKNAVKRSYIYRIVQKTLRLNEHLNVRSILNC